jgi:hypothetical protein
MGAGPTRPPGAKSGRIIRESLRCRATEIRLRRFDHRTAQALIALVKNDVLSRRHSSLRLIEMDAQCSIGKYVHFAGLIRLSVAHLRSATKAIAWRIACNPLRLGSHEFCRK